MLHNYYKFILLLINFAMGGAFSEGIAQQNRFCDPDIIVSQQNPYRYQRRGNSVQNNDRCEGVFIQQLSSTAFRFVSFTAYFENYRLDLDTPLEITWVSAPDTSTFLQAVSIKPHLYYRMDTMRDSMTRAFIWPLEVLASLNIDRQDIGILAWVRHPGINGVDKLHVPLRITQAAPSDSSSYSLIFLSRRRLSEVYVKVVDALNETVIDRYALNWGYYPTGRPIEIRIDPSILPRPGSYKFEISAEESGSINTMEAEFWFYHGPFDAIIVDDGVGRRDI